jgi:hypothetical protein
MKMRNSHRSLRNDKRAASPAISTVILTAAGIVMILVAMSYANNILSLKMAQNEFSTNQQFMQTTGKQIDDVAWTTGRSQTIAYSCKYGNMKFQDAALNYTFQILPSGSNNSFLLSGTSRPITQVVCEQKLPMNDGSYTRIALIPTMRVLTSTIASTNYFKFYLPDLENGTNLYRSQSITLTGNGIMKVVKSGVDQVKISVSYPKSADPGFDSSFFNFKSNTVTLNSTSTPRMMPNSVVEFYVGKVVVAIGQV